MSKRGTLSVNVEHFQSSISTQARQRARSVFASFAYKNKLIKNEKILIIVRVLARSLLAVCVLN